MSSKSLENSVSKILIDYGDEVVETLQEIIPEVGREAVKTLKRTSPVLSGEYAKGWTVEISKNKTAITVHNKKKPTLVHLVEYGHAKLNGGRVAGKPHVEPVRQWSEEEVIKQIEEKIGQ